MTQNLPEDFDWISVRADCSPTQVFQKLRLQIQGDVNKRLALMTDYEKTKFSLRMDCQDWQFSVIVEGQLVSEGVTFSRSSGGVDVHKVSSNELLYQGTLTLSNDGKCKLRVSEGEYDLWQFRKLALEDVLFTSVARWRQ